MQIIECASSHLLLVVPDESHLWRQGAPVSGDQRGVEPKEKRKRQSAGPQARRPKGAPRPA